jgi:hypothetical protein
MGNLRWMSDEASRNWPELERDRIIEAQFYVTHDAKCLL